VAEDDDGKWRPLRVRLRGGRGVEEHETLQEGVPPWLRPSLEAWVEELLRSPHSGQWSFEKLRKLERELRLPLNWTESAGDHLLLVLHEDDELFLEVVDYLLRDRGSSSPSSFLSIVTMLNEAGSAWQVVRRSHGFGLERRVPEEVAASARKAFAAEGGAGGHLRTAWSATYGRHPNPTEAYAEAVKAVEAAAHPVVTPSDARPTLGKMVRALRDAPTKWEVVLAARPDLDRVGVVSLMADLLWQGHTDRHGGSGQGPIRQNEAEAAVHLAILLVHWFTSGAIHTRS
jgi:hypothetical protein